MHGTSLFRDKSNGQFLCLLIAFDYEKAFRDPGSGFVVKVR